MSSPQASTVVGSDDDDSEPLKKNQKKISGFKIDGSFCLGGRDGMGFANLVLERQK